MYSWLEINKNAIAQNISQYKKVISNNKLAVVIKANAYGHGLLPIAHIVEQNKKINWLCVSHLSDAVFLRKNKIKKPILVLSCIDVDPAVAVHQQIAIVVSNYTSAQKLNVIGKQCNYYFNVHVKIDTGLTRLGVTVADALAFINYIRTLSHVTIDGIYSHFAQSQHEDQTFTQQQLTQFNTILKELEKNGIFIQNRHISNSAGTIIEQPLCNFFRVGIGMYGYWPSQTNKVNVIKKYPEMVLQPVLTWKTKVTEIRNVSAGVMVGYNCTYQTTKPTTIAIVPVGYYDGYQLRFSNKTWVRIKGNDVPVIGRVCMNMTLIDVSNIKDVAIGDEVILLGDYPKINADELAAYAQLDNVREIMTAINPQLPRLIV